MKTIAWFILFFGCCAVALSNNASAATPAGQQWLKCVFSAYKEPKKSVDRSAAVESAFHACETEEEAFWAESENGLSPAGKGTARSMFLQMKADIKRTFVEAK
jgi:hypothetical protein